LNTRRGCAKSEKWSCLSAGSRHKFGGAYAGHRHRRRHRGVGDWAGHRSRPQSQSARCLSGAGMSGRRMRSWPSVVGTRPWPDAFRDNPAVPPTEFGVGIQGRAGYVLWRERTPGFAGVCLGRPHDPTFDNLMPPAL